MKCFVVSAMTVNGTPVRKLREKIDILKSILIARATGRPTNEERYELLRKELLQEPRIKDDLPEFLQSCDYLDDFWNFIHDQSSTYEGRRNYINDAFEPVLATLRSKLTIAREDRETPSIFISHSSNDKFFVRKLAENLRAQGVRVWIDEAEIKVGDSLTVKIGKAIQETDFFGVVLSHNSVNSEWVQKELQVALQKEMKEKRIIVLPILMEQVEIPAFLKDKLYADFSSAEKFEDSFKKILDTIGVPIKTVKSKEFVSEQATVTVVPPTAGSATTKLVQLTDIQITSLDDERSYKPDPSKLLYNMYLKLSSTPSMEWQEIFDAERRFPRHSMWRRAWIEGEYVVIHCVPTELEQYHLKDLRQDVQTTNSKCRQYLTERAQEEAKKDQKEKEEREQLSSLKRRLDFS